MADILGDRRFVEVPGSKTHELPPLLLRSTRQVRRLDRVMNVASNIVDDEEMVAAPEADFDRRRMDLAVNLVDQYQDLLQRWSWGDSILEWIRQCEMTFETRLELRNLLRNDLWPHAGRSSFVRLLADKDVGQEKDVALEDAVGLRLTFRQPPPIACCSNQFLFYLKHTVAASAWQAWVSLTPSPIAALPPERFTFQILTTSLE